MFLAFGVITGTEQLIAEEAIGSSENVNQQFSEPEGFEYFSTRLIEEEEEVNR